jgi:hypothetical protein
VLVDYASYARRHGIEINHFSGHAITLKDLLAVAAEQDVEFRTGDVLFLRTGYVAAYQELDSAGRERVAQVREWCGLGQSRETTEWLWERQFAAVASDSPGFEVRRTYSSSTFSEIDTHSEKHPSRSSGTSTLFSWPDGGLRWGSCLTWRHWQPSVPGLSAGRFSSLHRR